MTQLILEKKDQSDETRHVGHIALPPPVNEDYWIYRVMVSDEQAIVAFPKFFTIGIGFAQEENWNTNLPHTCRAHEIFRHIRRNKGDDSISDEDCIAAILMIQHAILKDADEGAW
jgi:hypothetical protein